MVQAQHLLVVLVISTIAVEINSQYIDFFQSLQALFQPYPYEYNGPRLDTVTRRPATRKNNDRRPNQNNGITFQVTEKNHGEFSSTTVKPSRKQTRVKSTNRPTTKNPFNGYLLSVSNIFTTTPNSNRNKDGTVNKFDANSRLTDKDNYAVGTTSNKASNGQSVDVNGSIKNKHEGTNSKLINDRIPVKTTAANYEWNRPVASDFGSKVSNINRGRPTDNIVTDVNGVYFGDNNGVTSISNDNHAVVNNIRPVNGFTTKNPLNNQAIRPTPDNFGSNNFAYNKRPNTQFNTFTTQSPLLNAPPITNKPATESGIGFSRPANPGAITFTDQPGMAPDLEIGPNEDDMTEAEKRRYMEIAEEMCDNYKSLNVKTVVALPLVPQPQGQGVEFNVSDCKPINIPLIIGGKVSPIEEFPHMALIGWMKIQGKAYTWKCGGSLISDQYVLTAGHCTFYEKDDNVISGPPHAVQLGSARYDDPGAMVVRISSVIRHPKYKLRRSYFDVALIKLNSRITFTKKVRPACLGVPPAVGQPVIATGWGRTEFGGDQSKELRSVSLPIWDMKDCKEIWGTSRKLPNGPSSDSQVCAGDDRGGKDTCQGDSGGPAQVQDGCVWRVVAVTSYGRSCGAPDTPALYATVPRAFVAAQVFGKRKTNFGNTNQHNDGRNNLSNLNGNGVQFNGNGNINNNQHPQNRFNNRQQTGDRNNNRQQIGDNNNNRQQIGDNNNNRQQIGDNNNNRQQIGNNNNNRQQIGNNNNNRPQIGDRDNNKKLNENTYNQQPPGTIYPHQQQQLGVTNYNKQLGFRYDYQQPTSDRSTNTQQTDNRYNNPHQFGNRYDSQQQYGEKHYSQPQFGDRYDSQRQFGDRYDSQRQFGDRHDSQYGLENAYGNQQNRWDTNNFNDNKRLVDTSGYTVTDRPWWTR